MKNLKFGLLILSIIVISAQQVCNKSLPAVIYNLAEKKGDARLLDIVKQSKRAKPNEISKPPETDGGSMTPSPCDDYFIDFKSCSNRFDSFREICVPLLQGIEPGCDEEYAKVNRICPKSVFQPACLREMFRIDDRCMPRFARTNKPCTDRYWEIRGACANKMMRFFELECNENSAAKIANIWRRR